MVILTDIAGLVMFVDLHLTNIAKNATNVFEAMTLNIIPVHNKSQTKAL